MTQHLSAADAAALVHPADSLGLPLGPGQPPAFLAALGAREDWTDLRVSGALLLVMTELFTRPGVHYLSGFFGPFERYLRDSGANISFAPADFRRFAPLLERAAPRVMTTAAAPPDADGWCSLSLHGGGTVAELRRAGADPDRLLVVEVSEKYPRTLRPRRLPARPARERDRRAGRLGRPRPLALPDSAAERGGRGDRPARPPFHRRRRDPADRHRGDPLGHRGAARRATTAATTACTRRCSPTA